MTVSQNLYDSVTVSFLVGNAIPDQYCFVSGTQFGLLCSQTQWDYCARKHSSFSASGDAGFSVLTLVVTGARNLKKVFFKGDWSQSR